MSATRPRIVILVAYYLPGKKGGGTVRSLVALVDALRDEFDFRIVTPDREPGDRAPYPNVEPDVWTQREGAEVRYLSPGGGAPRALWRLLQGLNCDLLVLNGVFSRRFSMFPLILRRLGLIPAVPILIAARGELMASALARRSGRKRLFLRLAKVSGLFRDVTWLASTDQEADEIRAVFPRADRIGVAMDFAPAARAQAPSPAGEQEKRPGRLSAVFISRIDKTKNLAAALTALGAVSGEVQFSIYGPAEDAAYFAECERLIRQLPSNIVARYLGMLAHEDVEATFARHELFVFPTRGENFGHVIHEALSAGCPVLLSDRTPWRGLEAASAGWDVPLDDIGAFSAVLQRCVDAGPEEWNRLRAGARAFAGRKGAREAAIDQNRRVLGDASAPGQQRRTRG